MDDLKHVMEENFLTYASYVIKDRAIPDAVDGLKPVQRRILYTLSRLDSRFHKVANVVGQTMAYHPHGDAPIYEALVNLSNKGYLLDQQGNFGNIFTGDPSAAARYIETRLSDLARETMFNLDLTETLPTYDGRANEPVALPAKIPLLLLQGADGIAVGMATHILPHNFTEVLNAEIAYLEGESFRLIPDFPTGGILDARGYDKGRGKVKLRAKLEIRDPKTLVIKEICYGTTTESLIRSIDEAAKRGKIKIDSIDDYTAEKVEIEIKLPRGQYAEEVIKGLYAYTECEVSLSSQVIVIKDNLPWETDVDEILKNHADKLQGFLKKELEIEQERVLEKIFAKTLEQIFIENRLYKKIENLKKYEEIHPTIAESLKPYHKQLSRIPTEQDREKLLSIPIRRISRFDIDQNQKEVKDLQEHLAKVEKNLKNVRKYTVSYLRAILAKYGKEFPRRTELEKIEQVDLRAIETRNVKVGFDPAAGFVGTKVQGPHVIECTNFDKLLVIYKEGTYSVINLPEKHYIVAEGKKVVFVGVADKKTIFNTIYKVKETHHCYAKRFIVEKFILEKVYHFLDEGTTLEYLTTEPAPVVELHFTPKLKQKVKIAKFKLADYAIKGVTAKGTRLAAQEVKKVMPKE